MEGENVSHNTSYSETSPNVHDVDEELMDEDNNQYHQQYVYHSRMQNPYQEMDGVRRYPGESPEIPNISNSEIEEINYTMGPPAVVNQLTQRIIHLQGTFKVLDLINFKTQRILKLKNAFSKMKQYGMQSMSMSRFHNNTRAAVDLNQQIRGQQFRQFLQHTNTDPDYIIIPTTSRNPLLSNLNTGQIEGSLLLDSTPKQQNNLEKTLQKLLLTLHDSNDQQHIINQIKPCIDEELKRIARHYEDIERIRVQLNAKIEQVEQMELQNLENHLILEQKITNHREFPTVLKQKGRQSSVPAKKSQDSQTEITHQKLLERERNLELRESESQIDHFRQKQLLDTRERDLLRRERELDFQERLTQEKNAEFLFRQRELNQRLKDSITWPLCCLENESRLAEKIKEVKLTPEYYHNAIMSIEEDRQLTEFYHREENRQFVASLEGLNEAMRLKGEGLLKLEYVIIKERTKQGIVKDYIDSELKTLHQEKLDVLTERERYLRINEIERQLQDEKKVFDQQRSEFTAITENLKKNLQIANEFKENYSSNNPLRQETATGSVFDQALQKTSRLINNFLLQSPSRLQHQSLLEENPVEPQLSIAQRIDKILSNFDKLSELQVSPLSLDLIEKKEQNLDAIRKILTREAYFLDEEKKWIKDQKDQLKQSPQKDLQLSRSHIINETSQMSEIETHMKEVTILQHNLRMERELQASINQQLEQELMIVQQEQFRMAEVERQMNEAKLKMLIKFEKIKQLEDYYNQFNPDRQECLEIEVTQDEMLQTAQKVIQRDRAQRSRTEHSKTDLKLRTIFKMFCHSMLSREDSDPRSMFLQIIKSLALKQRIDSKQAIQNLIALDRDSVRRLGIQFVRALPRQLEVVAEQDWFDFYWAKRQDQFVSLQEYSPDQLQLVLNKVNQQREAFWRFKATKVLQLMNLHYKRRARMHMVFAFQHYKYQTQKSKFAAISTSKNFFKGPLLEDGYLTLDHNNHNNSESGMMQNDENQMPLGTPKLNTQQQHQLPTINSSNSSGDSRRSSIHEKTVPVKQRRNSSKNSKKLIPIAQTISTQQQMESRVSNYTGISEIIRQGKIQTEVKRIHLIGKLVERKLAKNDALMKNYGINRWKGLIQGLEMHAIKIHLRRLTGEVENLKFQEQVMKTNFRVQKTELESKVSQLVAYVLGQNGQAGGNNSLIDQ